MAADSYLAERLRARPGSDSSRSTRPTVSRAQQRLVLPDLCRVLAYCGKQETGVYLTQRRFLMATASFEHFVFGGDGTGNGWVSNPASIPDGTGFV